MNISKKIASLAVAGALILGGVGAVQSAQAALIPGTITVTPTTGSATGIFLQSINVSVAAPTGFRAASTTVVVQNGVIRNVSLLRDLGMAEAAGVNGLNGVNPPSMNRIAIPANGNVSNRALNVITNAEIGGAAPLVTGPFELRYYYHADASNFNYVTDAWVSLPMTFNATAQTWAVFTPPPAATATTTSLTASASGTSVALTATVAPVAAAGTVQFFEGPGAGTAVGSPTAVVAGVASTTLTGVTDGSKRYQAVFTPTDAAVFLSSTSAPASVNVGSIPAPATTTGNITVQVAAGVGGGALVLTASSLTANLGPVVRTGGVLTASGTVTAVVDDSRQSSAAAFLLTGQVGDFTDGARVLSSRYLGWTPSVTGVGGAGPIVVGGPVVTDGLLGAKTWATGTPSAADPQPTTTNASAILQLRAPLNTAAGNYSALMTVTLT